MVTECAYCEAVLVRDEQDDAGSTLYEENELRLLGSISNPSAGCDRNLPGVPMVDVSLAAVLGRTLAAEGYLEVRIAL